MALKFKTFEGAVVSDSNIGTTSASEKLNKWLEMHPNVAVKSFTTNCQNSYIITIAYDDGKPGGAIFEK